MSMLSRENITFKTDLTEEFVLNRLTEMVWQREERLRQPKAYKGEIGDNAFRIIRNVNYQHFYLPEINGEIVPQHDGTMIKLHIQISSVHLVAIWIWWIIALAGACFAASAAMRDITGNIMLLLVSLVAAALVLSIGAFRSERERAIKDLQKLWSAEIVANEAIT